MNLHTLTIFWCNSYVGTCSRTEHPWIASSASWNGTYKSIDNNSQPYPQNNAEDPFMWQDTRGHFHAIHHWQSGNRNRYFNGGHSFSRDGVHWTFSQTTAYTKNITWDNSSWTVVGRRERPGLLLDPTWKTPLYLFTAVAQGAYGQSGRSWLQSQPIRQTPPPPTPPHVAPPPSSSSSSGAGAERPPFKCAVDEDCNLNGLCNQQTGKCACDNQWDGDDCGALALLPADPLGGYQRKGYSQWGVYTRTPPSLLPLSLSFSLSLSPSHASPPPPLPSPWMDAPGAKPSFSLLTTLCRWVGICRMLQEATLFIPRQTASTTYLLLK